MPSTTKLLIEPLTIGSIGSIWLGLFVATKWNWFAWLAAVTQGADVIGPIAILVIVALVYQLGIFVNWIAWLLVRITIEPYRDRLFVKHDVAYKDVRTKLRKNLPNDILAELKDEVSELRITRANCLNLALISIALCLYNCENFWPLALLSLTIAVLLGIQTCHIHWHHYKKLKKNYLTIVTNYSEPKNK